MFSFLLYIYMSQMKYKMLNFCLSLSLYHQCLFSFILVISSLLLYAFIFLFLWFFSFMCYLYIFIQCFFPIILVLFRAMLFCCIDHCRFSLYFFLALSLSLFGCLYIWICFSYTPRCVYSVYFYKLNLISSTKQKDLILFYA